MNRTPEPDPVPTIDRPPAHELLGHRTEQLRCRLTDEEHRAKGLELATRLGELAELKEQHREERAAQKEAEADLEAILGALREDVADQSERRPVVCEEIADFARGLVEISRGDTGETVRTRPLTDDDRQRSLR